MNKLTTNAKRQAARAAFTATTGLPAPGRPRRRRPVLKRLLLLVVLLLVAGGLAAWAAGVDFAEAWHNITNTNDIPEMVSTPATPDQADTPGASVGRERAEVVRVIDGDTLVVTLNGVEERVRLAGIDAPEMGPRGSEQGAQPGAIEARDALNGMLADGIVYLAPDPVDERDRDRFDRLRRIAYTPDGVNLNQWLLTNGHATVWGGGGQ
jgi:micrococcal nuclease